jgi:hypothetical protein
MTDNKISDAGTSPVASEKDQKQELGEDANESTSTRSSDQKGRLKRIADHKSAQRCWEVVTWTPKRCRWNPEDPPKFSMGLNLLFGFVSELSSPMYNCFLDVQENSKIGDLNSVAEKYWSSETELMSE